MTINRGSEWRKWDLHVHTPLSIYQRFGNNDEETWEKYISDLENLSNDFAVVGINDYLFLDGYAKLKEEQENNLRLSNLKLLPVVEFRIEKFAGINFEKLKRINLHVIFSDEIPLETIQSQFLNTLEQSYYLESGEPWTRAITTQSVEELGNQIKSNVPKSELHKYGSDLTEGFNNLNVREEEIFKSLNKDCFKGKYLIAIGKTEWGDLKWTDASIATKKSIINKANIVFTASESINDFNKAKAQLTNQGVNDLLLDCSDAHYLSTEIDKDRIGNCNTWIKAQPTFEGLKQILYEPNERVKIQVDKPDFKEDKLVIDEIQFISENQRFISQPIKLNQNLNVIIGGKSSGKSILLYNIAKTLLGNEKIFKDEKIENKYNFREGENSDINFDFLVKTKVGIPQSRYDIEGKNIIPDIKYIPQNYLIKLAEPEQYKTGDSLNKVIRNLIIEDKESKEKYNDIFLTNVTANDKERERIIDNYFEIKEKIVELENLLKNKSNKEVLEKNIEANNSKITELKKGIGLSDDEIKKYNLLQKDSEVINIDKNKINNDYKKISKYNNEAEHILTELKRQKDIIATSLENEEIKSEFINYYRSLDEFILNLDGFISSYEVQITDDGKTVFKNENIFRSLLSEIKNRKDTNDKDLEEYRKNAEVEKNIKSLELSIEEDKKNLLAISRLNKEIETYKNELFKEKNKLFTLYIKSFKEYRDIIKNLKKRVEILEKDGLIINGRVKFNFPKFRNDMLDISHGTYKSYNNWQIFNSNLSALDKYDTKSFISDLKNIFENIADGEYILLSKISKQHAIKNLLYDYFFDYWEIEYKGDKLGKMSTGKASFVILMLIVGLSKLKTPILIDQPEDNLDNRSVSQDLVEYLKNKKKERQIILVTHNPNIVVNADAENIIVANQKGQNDIESTSDYIFDYVNGALEDSFPKDINNTDLLKSMGIREHIAEIVEGGKEAFKKREEKYGF
ncbi:TrlF family AAA-like ATPase [Chryseobacterium mucoviscidosis]|uniref:TrlF family AAA-like ATPase n=1 Tax=Chryseobacterium mucoviscidosis TaxID=1945581 RepID=UPI00301746BD